ARGWSFGHMAESLQLGKRPSSTGSQLRVLAFRQAPGRADEMRQTRLPHLHPVLVHPVAVTDQDPLPVVDEGSEGFFGATRMDHIEGDPSTRHHPEPL